MSKSIGLSEDTIWVDYYRYRPFILPVLVLLVCTFLFLYVIIPQMRSWLSLEGQITDTRAKVQTLTQDITSLSSVNDTNLDSQMRIVAKALPVSKDLISMLGSLDNAGVSSGVSISDYSVQSMAGSAVGTNQVIQLSLSVTGNLASVEKFITALKNEIPLADVVDMRTTQTSSALTITFFYKPLDKITFNESDKIQTLSASEINLINKLASYDINKTDSGDLPSLNSGLN